MKKWDKILILLKGELKKNEKDQFMDEVFMF